MVLDKDSNKLRKGATMMNKRIVLCLLVLVLTALFVTAACSSGGEEAGTEMPNPVRESSAEEIMEELGLELLTPIGADKISYYIIDMGEAADMAQVDFHLDGTEFTYRAAPAAEWTDISGMYYEWTEEIETDVSYCTGKTYLAEADGTKVGVILWFDQVPGIQYSLSMNSDADYTVLWFLAEQLYQPQEDSSCDCCA